MRIGMVLPPDVSGPTTPESRDVPVWKRPPADPLVLRVDTVKKPFPRGPMQDGDGIRLDPPVRPQHPVSDAPPC